MWTDNLILSFLGLSTGLGISAGLFAFLVALGVISEFADRTHTGKYVLVYDDSVQQYSASDFLKFIKGDYIEN